MQDASHLVMRHAQTAAAAGWEFITAVPVRLEDDYAVTVPTLADSTVTGGIYLSTFMVSALTATPGVFFDSPPGNGYSVDNLAPGAPAAIIAAYQSDSVVLDWDDAPESDLQFYRVYRSLDPGFVPSPAALVAQVASSSWTDPSANPWGYQYKVSAVDYSGNEGDTGDVVTATGAPDVPHSRHFALYGAVPNPFNPSTEISYSIAATGKVRLVIYNAAGRVVRTLVDEVQGVGTHEVRWNGLDHAGHRAASGVYLYQLRSGKFVETRRMVLLK